MRSVLTTTPRLGPRWASGDTQDYLTQAIRGRGPPNPAIGRTLGLAPETVANHVSNILTKLHVTDRAQAMIQARRAGLGDPTPPQQSPRKPDPHRRIS